MKLLRSVRAEANELLSEALQRCPNRQHVDTKHGHARSDQHP